MNLFFLEFFRGEIALKKGLSIAFRGWSIEVCQKKTFRVGESHEIAPTRILDLNFEFFRII